MQDVLVFIWKYDSEQHQSPLFNIKGFSEGIETTDYVCDDEQKVLLWYVDFGWFHDAISRHPMPLLAVLGARLAEIGVRTIFMVMTSIATLLFDELDQRLNNLADQSVQPDAPSNSRKMSKYLDEWKCHYNLVCEFTEHINRAFGAVLILICLVDYAVPIFEFQNVLRFNGTNVQHNFRFFHIIMRFLLILIASHRLDSKVVYYQFFLRNFFRKNVYFIRRAD